MHAWSELSSLQSKVCVNIILVAWDKPQCLNSQFPSVIFSRFLIHPFSPLICDFQITHISITCAQKGVETGSCYYTVQQWKNTAERKVVCFCTTLFNALPFLKLTVHSYAKHRIVWVCITLFSITLEVTSSSHMHTKSQNFTPHICPVISQTKNGCWLSLYIF